MKKMTTKKLAVSSTTIRNLSAPDLERVVGGQTRGTCSALCSEDPRFCELDTAFIHGCNSGLR